MTTETQSEWRSRFWQNRQLSLFVVTFVAAIGIWAYWETLVRIVRTWSADPDYSHGYLVLPLAVFFLWLRRRDCPMPQVGFHPYGLAIVLLAGLLRYLAGRLYLPELDAWSIPLWIGGACWTLAGWSLFRWSLPSVAFLWFASPIPATIAVALSTPLQLLAAQLSGVALQMFGQPAIVEGTTILLGDQTLEVERACSGLRMFYGITALAFATVLITRPSRGKAIGILLAVAPVAIAVNALRITSSGLLTSYFTSETARRLSHDLSGLLVIPVALFLFMGLVWLFDWIPKAWNTGQSWNWPLLAPTIGIGLFLAIATGWWWYGLQRNRALTTLLTAAGRFEQEGDLSKAVEYIERYTRARPEDLDQQTHLAVTYAKVASSQGEKLRSAELLRNAFRAQPQRRDLAIESIDTASQCGNYHFALELITELDSLSGTKHDSKLTEKRADVLLSYLNSPSGERQNQYSWLDVTEALQRSVDGNNCPLRHVAALAVITRGKLVAPSESARIAKADGLMDQLVAKYPRDPEAWLIRYKYGEIYWTDTENRDPDKDLDRAIELCPSAPPEKQVEVLLVAADRSSRKQQDRATAETFLKQAIAASPLSVRPYLALADLHLQAGDAAGRQSAIRVLKEGKSTSDNPPSELILALAQALAINGNDAEAESLIEPIRKIVSSIADAPTRGHLLLGIANTESIQLRGKGHLAEATNRLRAALDSEEVGQAAKSGYAEEIERSWHKLAELYIALRQPEQALVARSSALRMNPSSRSAHNAVFEAAIASGDLESAVVDSRHRTQQEPNSGEAWTALARAEFQQQLRLPPERRDFSSVERSIKRASELSASLPTLLAVYVDLLRLQNRRPEAIRLLKEKLQKEPDQAQIWQLLAIVEVEAGDFDAARSAIEQLAKHGGNPSTVTALLANLLVATGDSDEAVAVLGRSLETLKGEDYVETALLAAALQRGRGKTAEAVAVLEKACRVHPAELRLLERLTQYSLDDGASERADRCISQLQQLEGASGSLWKAFRVMRLLSLGQQLDQRQRTELSTLAREIGDARPNWPMGQYFLAQNALLVGDNNEAVGRLKAAWELGLRDATVAEPLLALLATSGRQEDIDKYAGEMTKLALSSPEIYERLMPLLLHSKSRESALAQARKWVSENPNDPQAYMRLGRACWVSALALPPGSAEKRENEMESEKSFREAVRLAPNDISKWAALISFCIQAKQVDQAKVVLSHFENEAKLEPIAKQLALAQLNDMLPRTAYAIRRWRSAVDLALKQADVPTRVATLSQAAAYFSKSAPRLSERYCRTAIQADPKAVVPKLILVRILGAKNDLAATNESLEILRELPDTPPRLADEKRRLTARLLAGRNEPHDIDKAIDLAEDLETRSVEDRLLLAELYGKSGRTAAAYGILDELVSTQSVQSDELVAFLKFWKEHFQPDNRFTNRAHEVLVRLGQLPKGLPEQLRWEIRFARSSPQRSAESNVDTILREVCRNSVAMQAWKNDQTSQSLMYDILGVLLDEGCIEEALALCRRPPEGISQSISARLLANAIILRGADDGAEVEACDTLLDEVVAVNPTDLSLLQDAADLSSIVGNNKRAADLYERLLAIDPNHQDAQNNFASLLCADPLKRAVALQTIQRALAMYPGTASLLNTEGEILVHLGRATEALKTLSLAAESAEADPAVYLHMAMAQDELGRVADAEESLVIASGLGLSERPLSVTDREAAAALRLKYSL
ncbi:MAG: exosortase [Pirellulales bacterium]